MSQRLVYQLLCELGGKATITEIRKLAKVKYPDSTLYSYAGKQLRRLQEKGYVKFDKASETWRLVPGEFPEK
jgi:DNA-binding IclR family transcriptional regulator